MRFPVYNPRLGGNENYLVAITDDQNNIIVQETVSESNLVWGGDFRYDFAPISNSKDRLYILKVSFTGENLDDQMKILPVNQQRSGSIDRQENQLSVGNLENKYITLLYTKEDIYPGGNAILNHDKLPGDLVFQSYYQVTPVEFVKDSLSDLIFRTRQDSGFFIFYILILCSLSALLIRQLLGKYKKSNK